MNPEELKEFGKQWEKYIEYSHLWIIENPYELILKQIQNLVKYTPNDQELGEQVRKLVSGSKNDR
jgi:hypothetical protein